MILNKTNALITGVGGFLGRKLAKHLLQSGANVIGVAEKELPIDLPKGIRYHQADVRNFDQLHNALSQLHIENATVFHLAAQSHVGKSRIDPLKTLSVNVMGTANLLEACRRVNVKRIIFPSTMLVYAKPVLLPIKETAAVQAGSVYASTKLASEELLKGYASDYGFSCRIARLGNGYGPSGAADSVVEIILRQVKKGGPVSLKNLAPIRDFIYCDDVVSGLVAMATYGDEPGYEVFNLASGVPTSIRELAELACRVGNLETDILETESSLHNVDDKVVLSIQRIKEYTQWQPEWTLENGLRQTLFEMG
jgi:nucleoside-diphosphate-sugar epimerase